MRLFLFLAALLPLPAHAGDGCHDLWFTRNLIMDRAGYCFGSALGQAVYDNGDCVGKTVSLGPSQTQQVNTIRGMEKFHGCNVNTSGRYLDVPDHSIRRYLIDLPIRDEYESACLGWLGPVTPLYSGHSLGTAPLGQIQPGDYVHYAHIPVGSWTYVTVQTPQWQIKTGGWLDMNSITETCQDYAG